MPRAGGFGDRGLGQLPLLDPRGHMHGRLRFVGVQLCAVPRRLLLPWGLLGLFVRPRR